MVMKVHKRFIVIAYDIANNKRRTRIVKELEKFGKRVNYSVFECLITTRQYDTLKDKISTIANAKYDNVIFYTLCLDCYSKLSICLNTPQVIQL